MSSIIVKLLTWVEHKIYKRFHSYYIEVLDSVKSFSSRDSKDNRGSLLLLLLQLSTHLTYLVWSYVHLIYNTEDTSLCLTLSISLNSIKNIV